LSSQHVPTFLLLNSEQLYNSDSSQYEYDNTDSDQQQGLQQRSVGDVVQNLHGGKYQFDNNNLSGLSLIGQQFAESMYSSTTTDDSVDQTDENLFDNNDLPKWVQKLGSNLLTTNNATSQITNLDGIIDFFHDDLTPKSIQIQNMERTWERYYTKIIVLNENNIFIQLQQNENCNFDIVGQQGLLAPRGSVGDGISDTATIIIRPLQQPNNLNLSCWVVIGTEEATWYYKLNFY
jgi:hypothetical protein